ncbi:MAG: lysoplasmalogenase [Notoacmeibacter sp.]|nr:lysoplasmalogenase [Notoacmeibacter sp.]MCC0031519.1 lysoplasmalogenase [Brucellaceae bacterium]
MLPFPGPVTATENGLLLISGIAALVYLFLLEAPVSWRRTVAKTLSTALLALVAFHAGGPWLLVAALGLSALGDFCLAHDGPKAFLGGLAAFLLAHLTYVALFLTHDTQAASALPVALLTGPMAAAVAALAGLFAVFMAIRLMPVLPPDMKLPVALYMAAIFAMAATAAFFQPVLAVLGAIAFMASDSVLAAGRFLMEADDPRHRPAAIFVWVSYFAAQVMLLLALV